MKTSSRTPLGGATTLSDENDDYKTDYDRDLPDVPWYKSSRVGMAVVSALGYTFFYVLRVNLSLAIVFMVKDEITSSQLTNNSWLNFTASSSLPTLNITAYTSLGTTSASVTEENSTNGDHFLNNIPKEVFNNSFKAMNKQNNSADIPVILTSVISSVYFLNKSSTANSQPPSFSSSSSLQAATTTSSLPSLSSLSSSPSLSSSSSHIDNDQTSRSTSDLQNLSIDQTTARLNFMERSQHCGKSNVNEMKSDRRNRAEFTWSKSLRGSILSSFFYGYLFTQFPGGWLATRFGAKHIFGCGMLISIMATFLIPLAARTHPYLLIALRILMGLANGAGFPSTHVLYSLWLPPLERTKYITFAHAGTMAGAIIALSVSGFICDIEYDNGWPLIFYIYGSISLVWYVLWNVFVYHSPLEHPRIDPIERKFIISKIGPSVYQNNGVRRDLRIPWHEIVRSKAVCAIMVAHVCNNWANYTILVCIPMFMEEVLKFNIKQNGILSSLPYLFSFFTAVGSGQVSDFLIRRNILSTTHTRKLFQSLSSGIPAVLLVIMGYMDCHTRYYAVFLLCLIVSINSFCRAGFMVNHVDIAPRYAGILFGMSNTLATIPGILSPIVVGFITPKNSREEWIVVFYICAALYLFSLVFYIIFGDGKLQKWAVPTTIRSSSSNGSDSIREHPETLVTKI